MSQLTPRNANSRGKGTIKLDFTSPIQTSKSPEQDLLTFEKTIKQRILDTFQPERKSVMSVRSQKLEVGDPLKQSRVRSSQKATMFESFNKKRNSEKKLRVRKLELDTEPQILQVSKILESKDSLLPSQAATEQAKLLEVPSNRDKLKTDEVLITEKDKLVSQRELTALQMSRRLTQLNKVQKIARRQTEITNFKLSAMNMQLAKPLLRKFDKTLQELKRQLREEYKFVEFLQNDFGLCLIKDNFIKQATHTPYFNKKDNWKHIVKLYEHIPDPGNRTFDDFKEIQELIKRLPWFQALGRYYKDEDALELAKLAHIKRIDMNKPVQKPGDVDNNYYFILRGKVAVGAISVQSQRQNFFITMQNSLIKQSAMQRQIDRTQKRDNMDAISANSKRSARTKRMTIKQKQHANQLFVGKFFVKMFIKKKVQEWINGEFHTKEWHEAHPIYQRVHDMMESMETLLCENMAKEENMISKALFTNKTEYKAEIEYNQAVDQTSRAQFPAYLKKSSFKKKGKRSFAKSGSKQNDDDSSSLSFENSSSSSSESRAGLVPILFSQLTRTNPIITVDNKQPTLKVKSQLEIIKEQRQIEEQSPFTMLGKMQQKSSGEPNSGLTVNKQTISGDFSKAANRIQLGALASEGSDFNSSETSSNRFRQKIRESESKSERHSQRSNIKISVSSPDSEKNLKVSNLKMIKSVSEKNSDQNPKNNNLIKVNQLEDIEGSSNASEKDKMFKHLEDYANQSYHSADDPEQAEAEEHPSEDTDFLTASTLSDKDLVIEKDIDHNPMYTVIKSMEQGMGFGETSIMGDILAPIHRMAYVHTLKPTFLLVIPHSAFRQMKRNNEQRQRKQLMTLLREVTLTKDQSHIVLKRFCDAIEKMEKDPQQKQVLYKEGEPANYIYIVLRGSFLITKRVVKNATSHQLFDENFKPASIKVKLKAQDIELKPSEIKEKLSLKFERWQLCTYCERSFIGEDDVMLGQKHMTTAICTSPTAELLRIPREKFLQLIQNNQVLQQLFRSAAEEKRHKFRIYIEQKRMIAAINAQVSSAKLLREKELQQKRQQSAALKIQTSLNTQSSQIMRPLSQTTSQKSLLFGQTMQTSVRSQKLSISSQRKPSYDPLTKASIARREKLSLLENALPDLQAVRSQKTFNTKPQIFAAPLVQTNYKSSQRLSTESSIINISNGKERISQRQLPQTLLFERTAKKSMNSSIYGASQTLQQVRFEQESQPDYIRYTRSSQMVEGPQQPVRLINKLRPTDKTSNQSLSGVPKPNMMVLKQIISDTKPKLLFTKQFSTSTKNEESYEKTPLLFKPIYKQKNALFK